MEVREIDLATFRNFAPSPDIVFNSADFNRLNESKAEKVVALAAFEDEKIVCAQIFGLKKGVWRAPFSAPFSSLTVKSGNSENIVNSFYSSVSKYFAEPLRLVWPAPFYPSPTPPKSSTTVNEYNYHYPLSRFAAYEQYLSRSGRYNHHRALKHNFSFFKTEDINRAYSIIAENRKAMGYPLAMSLNQVQDTIKIVHADFFVMTLDGKDVAAAMLFHTAPGIVQVIYWGDLPEARHARAMNHLAWRVFSWYAENRRDISIVDIGPASTDGILNEGLSQFKLSIGCIETLKPTITIQ